MSAPEATPTGSSTHDPAARRRAQRRGRERGCWVYVPAAVLEQAGHDGAEPPYYRTWAGRRRTILVQLYPDP